VNTTGLTGAGRRVIFAAARQPAEESTVPLTWAQQHMLLLMESLGWRTEGLNIGFCFALRPGLSEDDVLGAVRDLVQRFGLLRTVYVPAPEGPAQRVLTSGELVVPIVATEQGGGAAQAARVCDELAKAPFDLREECPIRVALVTVGGQPRQLVFAVSHLMLDHTCRALLEQHLRHLLARPPTGPEIPATVSEYADEAAWETSDAGRKHGERAVAHHELSFRAMPQTMLPRQAAEVPADSRYQYLTVDSVALAMAVSALAVRHNVSPSAVLYAGLCAVTGFVSSLDRSYLQLTVGNRTSARTRFVLGMYTEDVPVVVDLADAGMAEVIARSGRALVQAARLGRYPPLDLDARRRAIESERGLAFDLSCWLNYRTMPTRRARPSGTPDRHSLSDAAERTRWRWSAGPRASTSTYFVFADDAGDMLRVQVQFDSALLPPDEVLAWLRGVERLLCAATAQDIGMDEIGWYTGLTPDARGDGWCLTDGSWAYLPAVAELVRGACAAANAEVFLVPGPDGDRLTAYLSGPASLDIAWLHDRCVAALPGSRIALAPHRYVICAAAPGAGGTGSAGWRRLPVLAAGTGRV
jgi:Condensation domain